MLQPRRQSLSDVLFDYSKMFIAVVVALLLGFGGTFVVDCVAIEDDYESRIAKEHHEDLSAPQKHSTYVDHDCHHEESHLHVYQIDAQFILESINHLLTGYDGLSFHFAKTISFPKRQTPPTNAAQRTYFAKQLLLPQQYKSAIHPHVVILV